ncbi:hypothetical protein CEXT_301241 [Caerostris extrusa]|uniref:Uncharacterized protein n=1 Tax=Caerostris extrusa TaxID=172846 RepID=A0AAV4MCI9_CAEEX|nr:hypothetical protein CEXT_301241 [Caerostris extrusa]
MFSLFILSLSLNSDQQAIRFEGQSSSKSLMPSHDKYLTRTRVPHPQSFEVHREIREPFTIFRIQYTPCSFLKDNGLPSLSPVCVLFQDDLGKAESIESNPAIHDQIQSIHLKTNDLHLKKATDSSNGIKKVK